MLVCIFTDGESHVTFKDLLQFVTGADDIPILGFHKKATIDFFSPIAGVKRLPYASTCDLRIFLPRGASTSELSELLERGVLEAHGFGFI